MKQSGFNPHARWDRNIPETDATENPASVSERIEVLAWFKNGQIIPRRFVWKNKNYKIKRVTYRWQERLGVARISCFSVNTGGDLYQISFNNASYGWQLDKIIA